MKTWIVMLVVLVCAGVSMANEPNVTDVPNIDLDGWRLSILNQPDANGAFNIRTGYRIGMIEPFAGMELRLDSDPQTFDVGTKIHSRDIIEAESIPWLSDTLIDIFNEDLVLTGYTGFHSTINWVVNTGSYYGNFVGIEAKDKPDSRLAITAEMQFNHLSNELKEKGVDDNPILLGLIYRF